jgi:uncharacterized protein YlxW (UPF0749 family)
VAEHTSGADPAPSQSEHETRPDTPERGRRWRWSVLVPVVAAAAGLLFTTTANTAAGTRLRDDRRPELTRVIGERKAQVADETTIAADLQAEIDRITAAEAGSDDRIAVQQRRADDVRNAAGMIALHGPGIRVVLDDAPRRADGGLPVGARPDDVVVHQQDVQSVVNALWVGGAEAMVIMDLRVISTSAVRCVGNTLLLHGQVFSPPFEIRAIGDAARMRGTLDADPGVRAFRDSANSYGLGYVVQDLNDVVAPAYAGPVTLDHATAVR